MLSAENFFFYPLADTGGSALQARTNFPTLIPDPLSPSRSFIHPLTHLLTHTLAHPTLPHSGFFFKEETVPHPRAKSGELSSTIFVISA